MATTLALQFLTVALFFFMIGQGINARDLGDQNDIPYITQYRHNKPNYPASYTTMKHNKHISKLTETHTHESNGPYISSYGNHEAKQHESNGPYISSYGKHEAKQHEFNGPYITQYGHHEAKQHESNRPYITSYEKHDAKQPDYITGYKFSVTDPKDLLSTNPKDLSGPPSPNLDRVEAFKTGYFNLDDLHVGNVMILQFPLQEVSPYLSKKAADSIPLSISQLPSILQLFSIHEGSPQAKSMRKALQECQGETVTGETKICANSLDSMLEFVDTIIGSDVKRNILTTSKPSPTAIPLQKYTILEVSHDIDVPKWVACHPLPYPYAIYYCHYIATRTKVFKVSLVGDKNEDKMEALGICHFDTSEWNPNHIIFKRLGIKAGKNSPVCHFFPVNHLMWIPMQPSQSHVK